MSSINISYNKKRNILKDMDKILSELGYLNVNKITRSNYILKDNINSVYIDLKPYYWNIVSLNDDNEGVFHKLVKYFESNFESKKTFIVRGPNNKIEVK